MFANPVEFCKAWHKMLWDIMAATGNGYKRYSLRRTGVGEDRRKDKIGRSKASRRLKSSL